MLLGLLLLLLLLLLILIETIFLQEIMRAAVRNIFVDKVSLLYNFFFFVTDVEVKKAISIVPANLYRALRKFVNKVRAFLASKSYWSSLNWLAGSAISCNDLD